MEPLTALSGARLKWKKISIRLQQLGFAACLMFMAVMAVISASATIDGGWKATSLGLPAWFLVSCFVLMTPVLGFMIYAIEDEGRPLSGVQCVEMKALSDKHPQVAQMLREINDSGRPVCGYDLTHAQDWDGLARYEERYQLRVRMYETDEAQQRQACRAINGLA